MADVGHTGCTFRSGIRILLLVVIAGSDRLSGKENQRDIERSLKWQCGIFACLVGTGALGTPTFSNRHEPQNLESSLLSLRPSSHLFAWCTQ